MKYKARVPFFFERPNLRSTRVSESCIVNVELPEARELLVINPEHHPCKVVQLEVAIVGRCQTLCNMHITSIWVYLKLYTLSLALLLWVHSLRSTRSETRAAVVDTKTEELAIVS